jgi:hypothetical protein
MTPEPVAGPPQPEISNPSQAHQMHSPGRILLLLYEFVDHLHLNGATRTVEHNRMGQFIGAGNG